MPDAPTNEEMQVLYQQGKFVPTSAPALYATGLRIAGESNEFSIIFQAPAHFVVDHPTHGYIDAGRMETVAIMSMSPQTAKDLLLLLNDVVATYEKDYGQIMTAYLKQRLTADAAEVHRAQ